MTDHESTVGRPICPGCGSRSATVFRGGLTCLELCGAFWSGSSDDMRKATHADRESDSAGRVIDEADQAEAADERTLADMSPRVREANARMASREPVAPAKVEQLGLLGEE